jgi:glycine/D-amino acid oxidase-like deaminating enzyme
MTHVAVIGCGIVGAAIAYELSLVSGLKITVLDRYPPAQRATGAALGVLMGAISKKVKGRAWQLRQASMQRYEVLIPELEALTKHQIPFNRNGIVMLCFTQEDLVSWEQLAETRRSQGWPLEIWDVAQVQSHCPQLCTEKIIGAIYSPQDRQVDPSALTKALVIAAESNGVTFNFGVGVESLTSTNSDASGERVCKQIHTTVEQLDVDWLVVASGLGSTLLTASLEQPVDIRPVLGQALHLQLEHPLGKPGFQPVITGDDVHIVPVSEKEYWVGATVEFADAVGEVVAEPTNLEKVRQEANAFCPALAEATIVRTWSGKRPRPEGRPAPIIGQLPGYSNVLLATGHYRNGILLAPATAQAIRAMITQASGKASH